MASNHVCPVTQALTKTRSKTIGRPALRRASCIYVCNCMRLVTATHPPHHRSTGRWTAPSGPARPFPALAASRPASGGNVTPCPVNQNAACWGASGVGGLQWRSQHGHRLDARSRQATAFDSYAHTVTMCSVRKDAPSVGTNLLPPRQGKRLLIFRHLTQLHKLLHVVCQATGHTIYCGPLAQW